MALPGAISRRVAFISWWKDNMFGDFSNTLREAGDFIKNLSAALRTEWWKCGTSPCQTGSLDFACERDRRMSVVGLMMGWACCKVGCAQGPCYDSYLLFQTILCISSERINTISTAPFMFF